jgi:hypothetical protein
MIGLRRWAGQPSLRRLRMLGGTCRAVDGTVTDALPPTTVSAILSGRRSRTLPRLSLVERYVTACLVACGHDPADLSAYVDLWRQAWRALAAPAPQPVAEQEPAASAPPPLAPQQLPMATIGFVGRRPALATLDSWLAGAGGEPCSPFVVAITGRPGIGKTALALRWAHQVAERFEDGQLYACMTGCGGRAAAAQVLARFVRALGVRQAATELDELEALYRTTLAGKRALVVLDDVESCALARPFLPSAPGCAAVVTSRDDLSGLVVQEGARRLFVEPLTGRESEQLLTELLPPARIFVDAVVRRALIAESGGSPLVLRAGAERVMREGANDHAIRRTTTPTTSRASTYP